MSDSLPSSLKKKLIAVVVISIILGLLYYQSSEREKKMNEFIRMQQAPLQEAEKNKNK